MIGKHQPEINALVREFWSEPERNGRPARARPVEDSGDSHLSDGEVSERVFSDQEHFRAAFEGDYAATPYPSRSEAVPALLRKFAFYSNGDRGQCERLIRSSGIDPSKFDSRRGGSTWLALELDRALADTVEGYSPQRRNDRPLRAGESKPVEDDAPPPTAEDDPGSGGPERSGGKRRKKKDQEDDEGAVKRLSDAIRGEDRFAVDGGGSLYHYSLGAYRRYGDRFVKRRVQELLELWEETSVWSKHLSAEVVEYIAIKSPELWEKPPIDEVNVENGILNILTRELREHSPEFLSPVRIPVHYAPEATCGAWDKYVVPAFPDDAPELVFELAGDLIAPERSEQKAVLMVGEGSNGKSTTLAALMAFLGRPNTTAMSLQKIESNRFSVARLYGKLANICPDLPSAKLVETSMFKALTGNEGAVEGEHKYKEGFEFQPYCRLVFSANQVPRSEDATFAFFRRWLVVPFERNFEEEGVVSREELDKKLQAPEELSGVLNRALDVIGRVRKQGFTESPKMREAWAEFREMTDPVSVWFERNVIEDASAYVSKNELLAAYNADRENAGQSGMTQTAFGKAIKRLFPELQDAQRTVNGKPKTLVWLGIGLKAGGGPDPEQGPGAHFERNDDYKVEAETSLGSRGSLGFTNCSGFEEQDDKSGNESKSNNKGNRVNRVNPVNHDAPSSTSLTHTDTDKARFFTGDQRDPALTAEQEHFVGRLVEQGMSRNWAIAEVVGDETTDDISAKTNDSSGGEA